MKIHKGNKELLETKVIEVLSEKIFEIGKNKIVLGVPGGRSVYGIFKLLNKCELPWKNMHIFMIDERLVKPDCSESNYKLISEVLTEELINSGKFLRENFHPFIYNEGNIFCMINDYTKELKKYSGTFDVSILSIGEDGHVASLFPYHKSILDNSEGFLLVENSPKPPKRRVSASRELLLKSKCAIMLVFGEDKRNAYNNMMKNNVSYYECPASIIRNIKNSYVFTDLL